MDNNSESSDYESVHESSDTEYDSDSSVCSESVIAFDDLPCDIQLIQLHKHLIWENFSQTAWSQVNESENGHLDFQSNSSISGTKHIQNCDKPTDSFYLLYLPYLWNL